MIERVRSIDEETVKIIRKHFINQINLLQNNKTRQLLHQTLETEKQAEILLADFPEANTHVVLASVWLLNIRHVSSVAPTALLEKMDFEQKDIDAVATCLGLLKNTGELSIEAKIVQAASSITKIVLALTELQLDIANIAQIPKFEKASNQLQKIRNTLGNS